MIAGLLILFTISCNNSGTRKEQPSTTDSKNLSEDNSNKDFSKIGFELMDKEKLGDISLGLPYNEIIDKLGEPEEKTEPEIFGADGEYHQTLIYNTKGIELDLIGEGEKNRKINRILISSPCNFKTIRGVGIGSNYKDVELKYKEEIDPKFLDSVSIVAGSIYGGLMFRFENNTVKTIFIGASAE
jgi:hypothetical protein